MGVFGGEDVGEQHTAILSEGAGRARLETVTDLLAGWLGGWLAGFLDDSLASWLAG
jgi:hypothetical protein